MSSGEPQARNIPVFEIEYSCGRTKRHRMGEHHHKAKLSNALVERLRQAYDDGEGGYRTLGKKFNLPWRTVCDIVTYKSRTRG